MKKIFPHYKTIILLVVFSTNLYSQNEITSKEMTKEPVGKNNRAYKWGKMAILATANDTILEINYK